MKDGRLRLMALVLVALVIGFLLGTWRANARIDTGRADSTANGDGSISTDDWTYGFSADVTWIDANNTWHEDGPIDCLPPLSSVEGLRFAWTEATVEGVIWRPVVWIDCRSVPPP
jgi:hypothetical protein